MKDISIIKHIEKIGAEEEHLYSKSDLTDKKLKQLNKLQIEPDQCWDFLRQRRALRDAGKNSDQATVRTVDVVHPAAFWKPCFLPATTPEIQKNQP